MTAFDVNTTAEQAAQVLSDHITGKTVLINGVSPGSVGAEAARVIAKYANLVVLAGRNPTKISETIEKIKIDTPSANLRPLVLNLDSLTDVRKAAAEVNSYVEPIHVLINSSSVMAPPFSRTQDGFEHHLGVNHFGPFLFTALIFNRIVAGGTLYDPARVVAISSRGHWRSGIRFGDLDFSDGSKYDRLEGYGQSKTANILFANEIARRAAEKTVPVVAYSVHPGLIDGTNLGIYLTVEDLAKAGVMDNNGNWLFPMKSLAQGAASYIVAAFDHSILDAPGAYIADSNVAEKAPHAQPQEYGERLWELSEDAVTEKFII